MGLTPVAGNHLATIVTSLEMRTRPALSDPPQSTLELVRWPAPTLARYRALFRRVGAPWLWYSRLTMADDRLAAILEDPGVAVFSVTDGADEMAGMLELDFRQPASCEISYFGLVPDLAGQGHGRWLMAHALRLAWRRDVDRVWLHTCTLDHPRALGFYRASGFTPFKRTIETFPDPRAIGALPRDSAPQIPLLG